MVTMLAALAIAGQGPMVFGEPFRAAAAVAVPNPKLPGTLEVWVSDKALGCADVRGAYEDPPNLAAMRAKEPTMAHLVFPTATPGATASMVTVGRGNTVMMGVGMATLADLGAVGGAKGMVRLDVSGEALGGGKKVAITADQPFELCATPAPRPSLEGTTFTAQSVQVNGLDGASNVPIPDGWASGAGPFKDGWAAPDGRTVLMLSVAPSQAGVKEHVDSQVSSFQGNGWSAKLERFEAVDPRTQVAHWHRAYGDGPSTHGLLVFRYREGGEVGLVCMVDTDDVGATEVFAAVQAACASAQP